MSKVGLSEETNHDSKITKNKSCKRKQNDDTSQPYESSNKENNPISAKKIKKEPGLSKKKNIIAKSDELTNEHFIIVKPKKKEVVERPADPKKSKVDKNKSEKSQSPSSKNSSPQISPDITLTLTDESNNVPLTFVGASSSQHCSFPVEIESTISDDPITLNVSKSGKAKKKKKHHDNVNKEDGLIARINQVEQGIEDLKKELELQKQMLQKILDFWNEHRDTPSNHGSVELEKKTGCPQVGFTRVSDNSIHLGQGVFVPKNSYLTAASRSKTSSQFVRKMIMAVFSPKELQDCSVHGAKSNKVKQENKKDGLDPIRLQAVKDIFSYYLKESAQFDKDKHDAQMTQFYSYVSSKITDARAEVKRQPKIKSPESSDTEDIDSSDIEEDTVASDEEEDSGESTDEDKGDRNGNPESDDTVSQQNNDKVEETNCEHELETTVAALNSAEGKLNEEQEDENEPKNRSIQDEEKEKVTD